MRNYAIAAIPADGIGPEVIAAGITVLQALGKRLGARPARIYRLRKDALQEFDRKL